MKDVGIVGLPLSGKTTLFNALTRAGIPTGGAAGRASVAAVPVPDERVDVLAELERSRKTVHAQVRFVEVPGGTTAQGVAELRVTDALAVVLRAFGPDADPAKDWARVREELMLADLAVVDSALENARRRAKGRSGGGGPEVETFERAHAALSDERLLRDAGFAPDELAHLRSIAALTLKPWVPVANLEEGADAPEGAPEAIVPVYASIEAETAGMADEEARELLAEFGVAEPGLDRVVAASYRALDLITFLTTGEDETRAWEVRAGATAPEAAGVIHTDLQRGFIRAEVVTYEDLVAAGGWNAAKQHGRLRVEGKDYVVREGDVLHVRFAV
jgi:GTP-binding protein YchF